MTRNEEYLKTIMDALGGDSTKIPPYTIDSEDDLKYIAAALAERAANKGKFIVTLTPTAEDFSGTMDKTVAQIHAAYEAGQQIVFSLPYAGAVYEMFASSRRLVSSENVYYVGASFLGEYFIRIETSNDATSNIYTTGIYALTPAGD